MCRVSVIIPTHSRPHLLPRAVKSAQEAGTNVEVIVVDDASSDDTALVCRGISGIRYIRLERNQRTSGARNIGILASTGDYLAFLDDDDIRLPGTLDLQIKALLDTPDAGVVYGPIFEGDDSCVPLAPAVAQPATRPVGDVFWDLLEWDFVPCLAAVFRKSCIYRVGLLDPTLLGFDDWDLWIRIAEFYSFVAVDQPIAIWRRASASSGQGMSNMAALYLSASRVYRDKWLRLPRAASGTREVRKQVHRRYLNRVSDMLIWSAAEALQSGHAAYARRNVLTALRLNTSRAARPWTIRLLLSSLMPRCCVPDRPHIRQAATIVDR